MARMARRDLDLDLERRGRCVTPLHEDGVAEAGFATGATGATGIIFIYQNIKINDFFI